VKRRMIDVAGVELELFEAGEGAPLLVLHGAGGLDPEHRVIGMLGEGRRLVLPSHPGFGRSSLPDWIDAVDDLAYIHLDLMDRLGIAKTDLIGFSIGGWIAAEMATKAPERFGRIVLVGPVGVKTGPADRLDVPDIFALPQAEVERLTFHDPATMRRDPAAMSDEQLAIMLRNRESLAMLVWEPYMHNPKLVHRLQRVASPCLFVRGASDGICSAAYLDAYAALVRDARVATIAEAGHAPQIEQPERFAAVVRDFLGAKGTVRTSREHAS
jgi:pimeloyl-ACP methyl ester carboxylesterase